MKWREWRHRYRNWKVKRQLRQRVIIRSAEGNRTVRDPESVKQAIARMREWIHGR